MNISLTKALDVLLNTIESWFLGFTASLPNILVSIVIIVGFWYLSKLTREIVQRVFQNFTHSGPVSRLMAGIGQSIVFLTGIFISLGILHLDKTVSSLLAGAGVVGLAVGFAFQEIASNFIAGILIALRKPYNVGDILKINEHEGHVLDIDLRTTRISTYDGLEIIVPNKDMFTSIITNYTATPERRMEIEVGVSYGENLRSVRDIALKALESVANQVSDKKPEVFFSSFADSSINFHARVWLNQSDPMTYNAAKNEAVILIKEAFDQNGITIPFPIRTLDFGIKGGQKLREMLDVTQINKI